MSEKSVQNYVRNRCCENTISVVNDMERDLQMYFVDYNVVILANFRRKNE